MDNVDLSQALEKLMSDPQALSGAMELAAKLKGAGLSDVLKKEDVGEYRQEEGAYNERKIEAPPAVLPPDGGQRAQRRQLLLALRPYMSRERQEKIDSILKVLQLLEAAEQLGAFGKNV